MTVSSRSVPALISQGRITEVDAARWLCRVREDGGDSDVTVSIPSLYSHSIGGEGVHYMPEVGATCYICHPSDNARRTMPFLLLAGAATAPKDTSEQGGAPGSMDMYRPFLSPGDIALITRDSNGLILRRGGVTELRGTALAKIFFDPTRNQVLTVAEHYRLQTFGGSVEWKNTLAEKNPNGIIQAQYKMCARQYATSKGHSVQLKIGATEEDPINLQVGDADEKEPSFSTKKVPITLSDGTETSIDIPVLEAVKDSDRVLDLRVFSDETKAESELEGTETFVLGMDREGDLQVETEGATKISSSKWLEIAVPGTTDNSGTKKVLVTKGSQGSTEPVMMGRSFLTDLSSSLTEITTVLQGLNIATPITDALVAGITTSLSSGPPYLSQTLESE